MPVRTFAIGDIHGCATALETLIAAIDPTADDLVVTLGDYVDRGPDSRRVVQCLLDLRDRCQLVTLQGNHERMMLNGIDDESQTDFWLTYGGQETLASYGNHFGDILPDHVEFLRACRWFYETETHLFVHASYDADLPLNQQSEKTLLWRHLSRLLPAPHCSGKRAIVGHTPQTDGNIADFGHLVCIDTFCFGGGWLTAMEVNTGELWQANQDGELRKVSSESTE